MNNLQRLEMEVKNVNLEQSELTIYLQENGLQPFNEYDPDSATSKKNIYKSALSILESLANDPEQMKNIKHEDLDISEFATNLQNRIDQLERKIRGIKTNEQLENESNIFMLFDR
ncbi:hypothetical protein [Alkalibacillus aidingensis]|uniref:hypothetical protein n=1 Tax=Alkalibacillus aidingensis TaxID=2747607 RepID=UPI001660A7B0|nr:hypothetical protein [Alkalibacillus aidingensis]